MTTASDPEHGPLRLAILSATGGIGGHLLSWAADAVAEGSYLRESPAICW